MTLLINFITAVAWIWGAVTAGLLVIFMLPPYGRDDARCAGQSTLLGILAWAWLLARYCL